MQASGNLVAYGGNFVGDVMIKRFSDKAGKLKNAFMLDAILSNGDMFKEGDKNAIHCGYLYDWDQKATQAFHQRGYQDGQTMME